MMLCNELSYPKFFLRSSEKPSLNQRDYFLESKILD
nr:MAG TPA: hypothetical protein [Caudoviricetes sp.]